MLALVAGCNSGTSSLSPSANGHQQRLFVLGEISLEKGQAYLSELTGGEVRRLPDRRALLVAGSADQLRKTAVVLALVDGRDEYVVVTLAPLSAARDLPTNEQIAQTLGDVRIGTFARPPAPGKKARAIIDIHADAVVALMPVRFQREMVALAELGSEGLQDTTGTAASGKHADGEDGASAEKPPDNTVQVGSASKPSAPTAFETARPTRTSAASAGRPVHTASYQARADAEQPAPAPPRAQERAGAKVPPAGETRSADGDIATAALVGRPTATAEADAPSQDRLDITVSPSATTTAPRAVSSTYQPIALANGEDTLVLHVPEQLDLALLLDLAAEYLHLDYMYDPAHIKGQAVTLKLRGKLQGEIKVKELYPLLESVLQFKGFVMARHEGNLVTVVPVKEALDVDPEFVDADHGALEPGDMVVTRIIELQHVDVFSAVNLLERMKLAVTVSSVRETQTLIVTCYAHRMPRIERLLAVIDRPGRLRKIRFRALKYITANMLAEKTKTLADEFQTVGISITMSAQTPSPQQGGLPSPFPAPDAGYPGGTAPPAARTVYLDADERTNRILIIGYEDQLETVDQLIDAFDVPQQTLRTLQVYELTWVEAESVKANLVELGIIDEAAVVQRRLPVPVPRPAGQGVPVGPVREPTPEGHLVERPSVVILEATNALLVNATREQHSNLTEVIRYVDRAQRDLRTMKVYDIEHIDAEEARKKLAELQICDISKSPGDGAPTVPPRVPARAASPRAAAPPTGFGGTQTQPGPSFGEAHIVVLETTNALLVNAMAEDHQEIAAALQWVDTEMREEQIPYRIYPLENSSPDHLATVLQSLVQETTPNQDKEGKVIQAAVQKRMEDEITIVPDPNTYSLIVYASKKNQVWISDLVRQLDKRRPQVLIDVTLVEITKQDQFTYDLNLIESFPNLLNTSGVTGVDTGIVDQLLSGPRDHFADLQSNSGAFTGYYADRHVQALLQAMKSKNYGRVLAKPKILVNDNEPGMIKTTDTTYVETTSSIPVSGGGAGTDTTLIQTATDFTPYTAGITLDITPHISEGDLLRLDIGLKRSDFLTTEDSTKPPNTTESEVLTAVTVPDGNTVILGGLLKLNQNKGGTKVPILGDLPLLGGLFRGVNNKDRQSKLYVFVKAEIIRPEQGIAHEMEDLKRLSERNRQAFEKHEMEFQRYQDWPGVKPETIEPEKVLDAD